MIVPMHKYSFLVYHNDYEIFLKAIRDLGVLHIAVPDGSTPVMHSDLTSQLEKVKEVLSKLENYRFDNAPKTESAELSEGKSLVDNAIYWLSEDHHIKLETDNVENELNYAQKWGSYDSFVLKALEDHDIKILFYSANERDYNPDWESNNRLIVLKKDHPFVHFAVVTYKDEASDISINPSPRPIRSIKEILGAKASLKSKSEEIRSNLYHIWLNNNQKLEDYRDALQSKLDIIEAFDHSQSVVDEKVIILQGFVPDTVIEKVNHLCDHKKIVYFNEKVKPADQPPVLLSNNRFTSLFEPLGQLYSLPAYGELDMTPFFAPFFMMFFGFCLGDAGYGIVILLSTFIFKNKVEKKWLPMLTLVRFLSLATIFFGVLTGTFLGINLLEIKLHWIKGLQNFMIDSNGAFNLALMLGLFQIIFGLTLKAINNFRQSGLLYSIGPMAWILLILSFADIFITKMTGSTGQYLAWLAVILILFFSSPEGNIFSRLGSGVWELYGITGFVGDLLSYIRLFALGISGAILGMVINDIALRMLNIDYIGWILFIVFLVVGHSANLLIASLGSFVHPLRLTFVEFYKNAGFTGGGKAFKPLRNKK